MSSSWQAHCRRCQFLFPTIRRRFFHCDLNWYSTPCQRRVSDWISTILVIILRGLVNQRTADKLHIQFRSDDWLVGRKHGNERNGTVPIASLFIIAHQTPCCSQLQLTLSFEVSAWHLMDGRTEGGTRYRVHSTPSVVKTSVERDPLSAFDA